MYPNVVRNFIFIFYWAHFQISYTIIKVRSYSQITKTNFIINLKIINYFAISLKITIYKKY